MNSIIFCLLFYCTLFAVPIESKPVLGAVGSVAGLGGAVGGLGAVGGVVGGDAGGTLGGLGAVDGVLGGENGPLGGLTGTLDGVANALSLLEGSGDGSLSDCTLILSEFMCGLLTNTLKTVLNLGELLKITSNGDGTGTGTGTGSGGINVLTNNDIQVVPLNLLTLG